jgi:hypothetical protein
MTSITVMLRMSYLPEASLLTIGNISTPPTHTTYPPALGVMSISSAIGVAYMEIFQHHSPNTDLIRREFRPHAPSQVAA